MGSIQKDMETVMQTTLDSLLEGCQIIDFNWRYLYVNETLAKQGHQTKENLIGKTMMEVYPDIDKTEMFSRLRLCMEKREPQLMDNEFTYPDGKKAWFELRIQPIPQGIFIFSLDITKRKHYEEIIERDKKKNQEILTNMGEGLIVIDKKGNATMLNRAAEEMLGYTTKEVLGKPLIDVVQMEDETGQKIAWQNRPISRVLSHKKKIISSDEYYVRKNGEKFPAGITVTPLIAEGKIAGAIEVFRDISQEKAIDKAKSEFISIASHALRTPLGIAKWYLEVIEQEGYLDKSPEVVKQYMKEIAKNNERLLEIVRNLLSVSRIDGGKVKDDAKPTDIAAVIKDLILNMTILAKKNNITINFVIKTKDKLTLFVDPLRFREVLENLLANAIKYNTPKGAVDIVLDQTFEKIMIKIKDTGIGIPDEDKKKLFTKFFRSEQAIINNTEGSGLGLYMAKAYVDGWGGEITLQSEENKGSTFTVALPITMKTHAKAHE